MTIMQDNILNKLKDQEERVTLYLTNGFQLEGSIKGFDNFTILLNGEDDGDRLIYKHAISTVDPKGDVKLSE